MILSVPLQQAEAILGAKRSVALADDPNGITEADRRTIAGAAEIILGQEGLDLERLRPCARMGMGNVHRRSLRPHR